MTDTIKYPLDLDTSGTNKYNRILDERHTISAHKENEYRFIVPKMAPYFTMNYEVYRIDPSTNNRVKLERFTDYVESHPYKDLTTTLQKQICGSILILDTTISGQLSIEYNSIGGPFCIDSSQILSILANKLVNPVTVDWSDVITPPTFPPEVHYHPADNLGSYGELTNAVKNLTNAIEKEVEVLSDPFVMHLKETNPHGISLDMLGVAHIRNTHIATNKEVEEGVNQLAIITAAQLGIFANIFELGKNKNVTTTISKQLNALEEKFESYKKTLSNVHNYGVATNDNELVADATMLYARVSDVFKIIKSSIANSKEGLDVNNTKLLTPSVMHTIMNDYIPIGAMFYLPRAVIKTTRCVIPNGAKFDQKVYPDLYNYLGSNVLPGVNGMYIKTYNPGVDAIADVSKVYNGDAVLKDVNGSVVVDNKTTGGIGAHFHITELVTGTLTTAYAGELKFNLDNTQPKNNDIVRRGTRYDSNPGLWPLLDNGKLGEKLESATGVTKPIFSLTSLPILNNSGDELKVIYNDASATTTTETALKLSKKTIVPEPKHAILTLVMRAM